MCGIAGFWGASKNLSAEEGRALTRQMTESLTHRGPNAEGHWGDKKSGIFLGHRRLSILDLTPAGAQPMASHNGRYVMVFNGEIYNFKHIQNTLLGHITFHSHSDSEVLLESFVHLGISKTLELIQGMFAIALWDKQERTLTLIRDHVGKKPLYAGWIDDKFTFASELKALQKLSPTPLKIDQNALDYYKYFGFIPAPFSIYKNIYKVPAGHIVTLNEADILAKKPDVILSKKEQYWTVQKRPEEDKSSNIKGVLSKAVSQRMISDVPLGSFLSGGIDSSLVTALMQEHSGDPIKTYAIGFTNGQFDESKHAEKIAAHLGTDHTTYHVTEADTQQIIPDLPYIYDEPFADYSQIPTAILCRQAAQNTTVALSGDGGDEVFCGYKRYFMLKKLLDTTQHLPRKTIASMLKIVGQGVYNAIGLNGKRLHSIAGFLQEDSLEGAILRTLSINPDAPRPDIDFHLTEDLGDLERMMMIDTQLYLPDDILVKVDRASMFSSLEVRSPLLDKNVIEYAWQLPIEEKIFEGQGRGKKPLYDLLCQYVPEELVNRPKQGFSPPIAQWLRGDLRDWAQDLLSTKTELYEQKEMQNHWNSFITGQVDNHSTLWAILMAQSWILNNKGNSSKN